MRDGRLRAGRAAEYTRTTKLDPALSEHVRVAEQAWTIAEREPDAVKRLALWERAADAFADVDGDAVDTKVKVEAARAAVIAWKNAIVAEVPGSEPGRELPAREVKLIAALDRYAKYVDAGDPELPGVLFMKAKILSRFDQTEAAIAIYRTILDHHRRHEVAGYAASILLDAYNRLKQYDNLVALADELAKDEQFMRDHGELAAIVGRIQRQTKRKHLEQLGAQAGRRSGEVHRPWHRLPRALQRGAGEPRRRRAPLQRRRLVRDRPVEPGTRSRASNGSSGSIRAASSSRALSRESASSTARSRSTTRRPRTSRSTRRSTRARRMRLTR